MGVVITGNGINAIDVKNRAGMIMKAIAGMKSCRAFGLSASVVFNKLFKEKNLYSDSRSLSLFCMYQNGVVHTKLSSNYLIGLYLMTLDGSYQTGKTLVPTGF